jgi:hypothetical protein
MRRLISILNIMIERRQKWDASRYALSPADRRSTSTTQLLLAIHQSARAARGKARQGVEILLLSAINLVRVNGAPLRQLRHTVATSRRASRAILALNAASNFLRHWSYPLHRLRQSRTLHTLTFGSISGSTSAVEFEQDQ